MKPGAGGAVVTTRPMPRSAAFAFILVVSSIPMVTLGNYQKTIGKVPREKKAREGASVPSE
jgi:hypothetical protein